MGKILRFNEVIKVCGAENLLEEIGKDAISLWLLTGKTKPEPKTGDFPAEFSVEHIKVHAPQIGVTGSGVAYDGYAEVKARHPEAADGSAPDDGGQAFPHVKKPVAPGVEEVITSGGMSLRDYFAAKAMQGEISSGDASHHVENIASRSYAIADAMLRARSEKS